jgi:hypothetical protein
MEMVTDTELFEAIVIVVVDARTGDAVVEAVAMPFSPVPEVVVRAVLAMLETVEDGVELLLLEVVNPPTVVAGLKPAVADVVEDKEL